MLAILVLHVLSTVALAGLIWTMQIVHYPLFAHVGAAQFSAYHAHHTRRIGAVVGVMMPVELVTAVVLALSPPAAWPAYAGWVGLGLVAVVWATTALVQVPQHNGLSRGHADRAIRALVAGNWVRTVVWSVRAVGACVLTIGASG